jgi:MFS transporter, PAT family, beta-lactamase induction signal transducer AmpG
VKEAGGWLSWLAIYRHPKVLAQLFLAFSAGLPFLLVFSTLSAWLKQEAVDLSTIGMLSWVGLAYTLKFFWAPIVDRVRLPWLTARFGRRRSWMLLGQLGIATGLALMSRHDPSDSLAIFVWLPLLVAFSSATQDIAIDAWRIEVVPPEMQGAMAASYQLGYRIAITVSGAGALWIAADVGWSAAYLTMAALVGVGIATTLVIDEPQVKITRETAVREQRVVDWVETKAHWPQSMRNAGAWFIGSIVCPFVDFFARYGAAYGALILVFAGSYRLTDFTMGVMANPFYLDVGYSLKEIAAVAKGFGIVTQIFGAILGGIVVARLGAMRSLLAGIVLVIGTNLSFATLAFTDAPSLVGLALVVGADNIAMGVAGTALVAYLSGLTNAPYTATQYALFSSFYALPGKLMMGGSGFVVEAVGYPMFFVYTSLLGVPALVLLYFLNRGKPASPPPGGASSAQTSSR